MAGIDLRAGRQRVSVWNAWLLAARPRTLPAAVAPVAVGTSLAYASGAFHAPAALTALCVALLLQIASNLANDALDFLRGVDTGERVGPLRVTQSGLLPARSVLAGTALVLALAMAGGMYLVSRGGWPLLVAGVLAVVTALAYTGGPLPLGYLGLGEVAVFIFFGLVGVAGTFYVQSGVVTWLALLAAVPVGCLVTAILVVNNLRDIETDRRAGKWTLAARFGRRFAIGEYTVLLLVAYLILPALWLGGLFTWWVLPWLTGPLAVRHLRGLVCESGPALNRRLAGTAQLALLFSALFSASILL